MPGGSVSKPEKPATGFSRRKQGRLSMMPSLSLDVLYEVCQVVSWTTTHSFIYVSDLPPNGLHFFLQIFGHLCPIDLLHLSRVSQSFRQVLMSRSSAWLWRSTFSNLNGPPTPPRPEEMSEPAWTHLLFGDPFCDASTHSLIRSTSPVMLTVGNRSVTGELP